MTNADTPFLVEPMGANALVHEALHRLLVRSTVKLVALLVVVTAGTVRNFPLAQHVNLVLRIGAVVGIHRERIVLFIANAFALTAQRSDAELGDALVRIATRLFKVHYRQAGGVLGVGHESSPADALVLVADGVGRLIGAVRVLLAGFVSRSDNRSTLLLEDDKVVGAGTIEMCVIAMREVIINNTLFIDLAGFSQFNGFADTPLPLLARNESIFANAQISFRIAVGIFRMTGTLASNLVGYFDDYRFAIGLITAVYQFAEASTVGARALDGTAIERFALFVIVAVQIEQLAGTNGAQQY